MGFLAQNRAQKGKMAIPGQPVNGLPYTSIWVGLEYLKPTYDTVIIPGQLTSIQLIPQNK